MRERCSQQPIGFFRGREQSIANAPAIINLQKRIMAAAAVDRSRGVPKVERIQHGC